MNYYCHVDSSYDINNTNLQLYSLERAADEWNDLVNRLNQSGIGGVDCFKERLAFITSCLGLSLSQLIGQNTTSPEKEDLEQPGNLFSKLINLCDLDRITKNRLNKVFRDFLSYYADIRHFGKVKGDKKYKSIDRLSIEKLNNFKDMTIEIWDIVIKYYRKNKNNKIDDFSSISELIYFEKLEK